MLNTFWVVWSLSNLVICWRYIVRHRFIYLYLWSVSTHIFTLWDMCYGLIRNSRCLLYYSDSFHILTVTLDLVDDPWWIKDEIRIWVSKIFRLCVCEIQGHCREIGFVVSEYFFILSMLVPFLSNLVNGCVLSKSCEMKQFYVVSPLLSFIIHFFIVG